MIKMKPFTTRLALTAAGAAAAIVLFSSAAANAQSTGLMYVAGYTGGNTSFIDEYSWSSTGTAGGVSASSLLSSVTYTTGTAPSSVNNPNGMAVGPDGRLYVASVGYNTGAGIGSGTGNSLIAYSANLSTASVAISNIDGGLGTNQVYWSGNSLYVSTSAINAAGGRVYKYNYNSGTGLVSLDTTFGTSGFVTLAANTIGRGLVVSGSTLYVVQSDDVQASTLDAIRVYDASSGTTQTGDNTSISGGTGNMNSNPRGVALVGTNLYVTDLSSSTLYKYNTASSLAESSAATPGGYRYVVNGPDGQLYFGSGSGAVDYYNLTSNTKTANLVSGLGNVQAVAFSTATAPEPSGLALAILPLIGAAISRRRSD